MIVEKFVLLEGSTKIGYQKVAIADDEGVQTLLFTNAIGRYELSYLAYQKNYASEEYDKILILGEPQKGDRAVRVCDMTNDGHNVYMGVVTACGKAYILYIRNGKIERYMRCRSPKVSYVRLSLYDGVLYIALMYEDRKHIELSYGYLTYLLIGSIMGLSPLFAPYISTSVWGSRYPMIVDAIVAGTGGLLVLGKCGGAGAVDLRQLSSGEVHTSVRIRGGSKTRTVFTNALMLKDIYVFGERSSKREVRVLVRRYDIDMNYVDAVEFEYESVTSVCEHRGYIFMLVHTEYGHTDLLQLDMDMQVVRVHKVPMPDVHYMYDVGSAIYLGGYDGGEKNYYRYYVSQ